FAYPRYYALSAVKLVYFEKYNSISYEYCTENRTPDTNLSIRGLSTRPPGRPVYTLCARFCVQKVYVAVNTCGSSSHPPLLARMFLSECFLGRICTMHRSCTTAHNDFV
ncbi:unnamed protein product, partial [Laminaria digitata]